MWELEKAILVTNNDRVYEKYKDQNESGFFLMGMKTF